METRQKSIGVHKREPRKWSQKLVTSPYPRFREFTDIWVDIEKDPIQGSGQRGAPDQENEEHNIRECSGKVDHLSIKQKKIIS